MVAPDGYILDIHGPYFSDSRNNDAAMLTNELQRDIQGIREWFQEHDLFIVDRGYRDAIPLLQELGIDHLIPNNIRPGERQLSVEEANHNRIITKTRWIVESRNGHFKSIFKFFADVISMNHALHLKDFYLICGAIINKYREPILMQAANVELAEVLLQKSREENTLQIRIENENLLQRRGTFVNLEDHHVPDFPRLNPEYLSELTVGTYQLKLAPSYIQDARQHEQGNNFQIDTTIAIGNVIRLRLWSRFRNAVKYQIWIQYDDDTITGHYCTCKVGARTVGMCAHITSVIWFLGYSRHLANIRFPSNSLLEKVRDVSNRFHNQDNI